MATVNIRRDVSDPFYRYKMERLQSKIEGKGNGIKTVIVNLSSVAQSLARPPVYVIKYFAFELGALTTNSPADDRWIINGSHDAAKLQDYLDGFISRFVLCKKCKNPETEICIKDGCIFLDCKACGQRSDVDLRLKLSSLILKNQPKKGKKCKSTKKAERRARKEAGAAVAAEVDANSQNGSLGDSNSEHIEENGDTEVTRNCGDELIRRIDSEAKVIDEIDTRDLEWAVDTSEAAVKARAKDLPNDLKRALVVADEEDHAAGDNPYNLLGEWIQSAAQKNGVQEVSSIDIYLKAKELGIEMKHKTLTVLAQTIFDGNIVKQIAGRASMLKKFIASSERHEKAFLGGLERFVGMEKPTLIPYVSAILMECYGNDVISEPVLKFWGSKASKKYVDLGTSKKVRKSAEKFMEWLENAESEDESE